MKAIMLLAFFTFMPGVVYIAWEAWFAPGSTRRTERRPGAGSGKPRT